MAHDHDVIRTDTALMLRDQRTSVETSEKVMSENRSVGLSRGLFADSS